MVKKKSTRIKVSSNQSGLTIDGPVDGFEILSKQLKDKWFLEQKLDLQHNIAFYEKLTKQEVKVYKTTFKTATYRLTFGGCSPLDHAGSLALGGRFNIGGAQHVIAKKFFKLNIGACIYTASSIACAKAEVGQFARNADKYKLTPKKPLKLLNLEKTIQNIKSLPSLKQQVDAAPTAGLWSSQSVPQVSQLLATYLRFKSDFDGLIYPSTRYHRGKIIAIFIPQGKSGSRFFIKKKI